MRVDEVRLRKDIAEAFDFVRFLVRRPRTIGRVKNGAEIEFLPEASRRLSRAAPRRGRGQTFYVESVFRGP